MSSDLITLTFIIILALISPGPDFTIVLNNSLTYGRSAGFLTTAGVTTANFIHVLLNILGLSLLIAESPMTFDIFKLLGASYLIYIGVKGLLSKATFEELNPTLVRNQVEPSFFIKGFLACLLNPKVILFYLAFFSSFLPQHSSFMTKLFYGIWINFLAFVWFSCVTLFFSINKFYKILYNYKHIIERITGLILIILGLKVLQSSIILKIYCD